jgi:hypothetical protein
MNERNKELYQMAVKSASAELHEWNKNWQPSNPNFEYEKVLYKKFAELVVRECIGLAHDVCLGDEAGEHGDTVSLVVDKIERHFGLDK